MANFTRAFEGKAQINMQRASTPEVSDLIGERLRANYHALEEQSTPKLLLDLLKKLETADDLKRHGKSKRDVF